MIFIPWLKPGAIENAQNLPVQSIVGDGGGFFIGKVAQFKWGERPFHGYMSEVRLWNVARTENQIKQNMLMVDPNSEGLAFYYKLNGADQYNEGDQWYIKDTSGRGMNGQSNKLIDGTSSPLNFVDLDQPISVK